MKVYKLKYETREEGLSDLIEKGILNEDKTNAIGTHAIVEVGIIVKTHGVYGEDGEVITEPVFRDGYHFDIMVEGEFEFTNEVNPETPSHMFAS